jgi:branched-chain amino acid transport system substrate-binding protein
MNDSDKVSGADDHGPTTQMQVSRREFLRMASAVVGAIAGLGAGLGGVLAGCGGGQQPSNTTATIAAGHTTALVERTPTTVVSGPESGRDIKIGLVSAKSGPLALFGRADDWWTGFARVALPEGALCGDGKLHRFAFMSADNGSEAKQAARAAADLISHGEVDVILASGEAEMVNPVADQAETLACPCLCSFVEWRSLFFGRGGVAERPFKWTYAHAFGLEDIAANFIGIWDQLETNKKVGFLFADDADGRMWADATFGLPPAAAAAGYECVSPGLYPVAGRDYLAYISEFQKNGCEICCGAAKTTDFIDFRSQSLEQGYKPKMITMGKALLFPQAIEAAGDIARNVTAESLWRPDWPYRDSITGKTCRQLADDYMAASGDQWIAPIAQYAKFEWVVDVFRRVGSVDSPADIIARVRSTDLDTCLGPIDFTAPIDMADVNKSKRPLENVYKAPVGGVQWIQSDIFPFEPKAVTGVNSPDLPIAGKVEPLVYEP